MFSESEILSEPISAETPNCHFFFESSDDSDGYKVSLYIYDRRFDNIVSFNVGDGTGEGSSKGCVCIKASGNNGVIDFMKTFPIKKFHNYTRADSKFAIMHLRPAKNIDGYLELLYGKTGKAGNLHIDSLTDLRRDTGSAVYESRETKRVGFIYCTLDI